METHMFNENKTKWLSINFKETTMGRTKKSIKYEYNCYRFSNATKKNTTVSQKT